MHACGNAPDTIFTLRESIEGWPPSRASGPGPPSLAQVVKNYVSGRCPKRAWQQVSDLNVINEPKLPAGMSSPGQSNRADGA